MEKENKGDSSESVELTIQNEELLNKEIMKLSEDSFSEWDNDTDESYNDL